MSWIGVDLDGTLAKYDGYCGPLHIGDPVPEMVARVQQWLADGIKVKVFTARVYADPSDSERMTEVLQARKAIVDWCKRHIGVELEVTCTKDYGMWQLWDDRAVRVVANTGKPCCEEHSS